MLLKLGLNRIPVDFHFRNAAIWDPWLWKSDNQNVGRFPLVSRTKHPVGFLSIEVTALRDSMALDLEEAMDHISVGWKKLTRRIGIWGVSRQTEHQGYAVQAKCMSPKECWKMKRTFPGIFPGILSFSKPPFYSKLRHLHWKLAGKQQCATTRLELFLTYTVTR